MSSIPSISSNSMQYLIQQATQTAQASKSAKAHGAAVQDSFAATLGDAAGSTVSSTVSSTAANANALSSVTMASLAGGSAATSSAPVASANAASLLNIMV